MSEHEIMMAAIRARTMSTCTCIIGAFLILYYCSNFWPLALLLILGAIDIGAISCKHSPVVCPHCGKGIRSENLQNTVEQRNAHHTTSGIQK